MFSNRGQRGTRAVETYWGEKLVDHVLVKECRLMWLCFSGGYLSSCKAVSAMLPALNLNIWLCMGMAVRISPSFLLNCAWYFC